MNAKKQYNEIVERIESLIKDGSCLKPYDIAEKVSLETGRNLRDLATVFSFLTGQPLIQYIRSRQMMAAYQSLLKSNVLDIDRAIGFTGLGDQPAFTKSFRQYFHTTPKQAFKDKNARLYQPALTWELISDAQSEDRNNKEEATMNIKTLFGVDTEVFNRISEAMDYQAMYGFSPAQSNAAYKLSEKTGCSLKDCFAYVDNFCVHYYADSRGKVVIQDESEFEKHVLKSAALAQFCISYDLSIEEGYELITEFASIGLHPGKINPYIIQLYLEGELDIRHFWYAYNWGLEHGLSLGDMHDFLFEAANSESLEEALYFVTDFYEDTERSLASDWWHEEQNPAETFPDTTQEEDLAYGERFDEDYDIDNLFYNDNDDNQ